MSRPLLRAAPLLLVLPATFALANWPSGAEIPGAVLVDLTRAGLNKAAELIPTFVPDRFYIGDFYTGDDFDSWYLWWEYGVTVTNIWGEVDLNEVTITPATGALNFGANGQAQVNSPADPLYINVYASLYGGTVVNTTCAAYIDPFDLDVSSSLGLAIVDNGFDDPYLDAAMGQIYWTWGLDGSQTQLRDCAIGDIDEFFDEYVGWSPIDWALGWVIDFAEGEVDSQLQDLRPTVEETIESAFTAASVDQTLALGDNQLNIKVYPSSVDITNDGVRVVANGSFVSEPHPCVAEYKHTSSLETSSDRPDVGDRPADVFDHHMGIMVDDDFLNQGLFAVYNGGTLCYTAEEGSGLPINTTILSILDSEAFGPLFPEQKTMVIQTRPAEVPTASAKGDHDLNLEVRKLGVDFYADLDDRMALMLGADLDVDAGADVTFDNSTGWLGVDVALSSENITPTVRSNEFAPGHDEKIATAFTGLFKTIVEPMIGGLITGLGFGLPSFQSVGLDEIDVAPSGPQGDWIGVYATAGVVPYTGSGCDGGTSSCGSGCGNAPLPTGLLMIGAPVALALLRRRRV